MIVYTMIGTTDLRRAIAFYDPIFALLGLEICWRDEASTSWGKKSDPYVPRFFTGRPFDGRPATVGNGAMTALLAAAPVQVDRLFAIAMQHGGTSEGDPGPRPQYGDTFYGAYLRDPDGNKLAFVYF